MISFEPELSTRPPAWVMEWDLSARSDLATSPIIEYSPSSARTYRYCEKKFYFKWLMRRKQGWRKPESHPWRQVHIYNQVKRRQLWAGDLYHKIMAHSLEELRSGHRLDETSIRRLAMNVAAEQFAFSERRDFVHTAKSRAPLYQGVSTFLALFEHAYDQPVNGLLRDTQQRVDQWLRNTFAWSGWLPLVEAFSGRSTTHIEPLYLNYTIAGGRVVARMDVGIEDPRGQFMLYDWKCYRDDARFAEYDQEMFKHQLLAYGLWPILRDDAPLGIDRVAARVFNPTTGEDQEIRFTEEDHADFELEVGHWVRVQRKLFTDVSEVEFDDLSGPYEPSRSCPWCEQKAVCGMEVRWHEMT